MAETINVGVLRALLTLDSATYESGMRQAAGTAKQFTREMNQIGQQMTSLGSRMTAAISLPIVAGFGAATKAAIDFESSFAGVRKTVDATEAEFAAMSKQFRDLSKIIPVNVNEINRLGEAAGALGIPKQEIVGFAEVMAKLGVTTNVTADQAAESIAKIQNIFGASGKATEEFASTLVDLGNKGASTEAEILALTVRMASAGRTAGMTQDEVLGFASAIANVGMEAEAGGSAFSRVILEMGKEVEKFAKVAEMPAEAFRKLSSAEQLQAVVDGLGKIQASGGDLNATLETLGLTELRQADLMRRLAGAAGMVGEQINTASKAWREHSALSAEAEKRFATLESQLTILWNRVKDLGVTLGIALLPMIKAAADAFTAMMPVIEFAANTFAAMPMPLQALIVGFGLLVAAIGPLLVIIGQMSIGIAALSGLGGLAGLTASLGTVATTILGTFATAGTWLLGFFSTTLPAALGTVIAFLGPQGLIALGLLALAGIWYVWGEDIKRITGEVVGWVVERFGLLKEQAAAVWSSIVDAVKTMFTAIGGYLKRIPSELLVPLLGPIGAVVLAFQKWDVIAKIAEKVYTAVKTWLVDKFAQVVKWVGEKVGQVTKFFEEMYTAVVGRSFVPDMIEGISTEFGKLDRVMVRPAELASNLVQSTFRTMRDSVSDTVSSMLSKISGALQGWLDGFLPGWASKLVGTLADTAIKGVMQLVPMQGLLGGLLGGGGGAGGLTQGGGLLAGLLGGGGGAANASVAAVTAGNAGIAGATGGGGMLGGMGALMTNPWTIGIAGAIAGGIALWKTGVGRGGEEGTQVNPARDQFFGGFQEQFGGDQFSALAAAFADAGVSGDIAERLIADLYRADEMDEFRAAAQAIQDSLAGAREAAEAVSGVMGEATAAFTQFEATIANVEASGTASHEAISALRSAIAELKTSNVSSAAIEALNTQLTQMIAEGTASDEAILGLTDQVQALTEQAGPLETQVVDTTVAADGMTASTAALQVNLDAARMSTELLRAQLDASLGSLDGFASSVSSVRDQLSQPIQMPAIEMPAVSWGGMPELGEVPSFANEGIVRSPMAAIVGDAGEPEWILHESSVLALLRRGMSFGASLADAATPVDADGPAGTSGGGGDTYNVALELRVDYRGDESPEAFVRRVAVALPRAVPVALRRDDGLRRKIRGATR